ncbi:MAG: hypothetical protein V7723_05975 [Sneathiella sp.]|uniref:hypothetical protein n=1 Tax=Sneathiella sp. TaxID=1964365 RepID=UPI003001F83C
MRAFLVQYAKKAIKQATKSLAHSQPVIKPFYQLRRVQPFTVVAFSKHISDTREPEAAGLFTPYFSERSDWVDIVGHSVPSFDDEDDISSVLMFYEEELYGDAKPDPSKTTKKASMSRAWPVTVNDLKEIFDGDETKLAQQVGKKKASEITVELAVGYLEGKNVRLFSCSAGRYSEVLGKNLAQDLANKLHRYVIAETYDGIVRHRDEFDLATGAPKERGYAYLDPTKGSFFLYKPGGDASLKQPGRELGREKSGAQKIELNMGNFSQIPWVDTATDEAEKLIAEDLKDNPKLLDRTEDEAEASLNSISQLDNLAQPDTGADDIDVSIQPLVTQDMSKMDEVE